MASSILRSRALAASLRAPALAPRTYATIPNPTQPTDSPEPSDVPTPKGSGSTFWLLVGGTAAAVGGWYYMREGQPDIHAKRKADQEEALAKARELTAAGKRTVQDTVREGEKGYDQLKASGTEKVNEARAKTSDYVNGARSTVERQYDAAMTSVGNTYTAAAHTVEEAEARAKAAAEGAKQATQSWGAWLGSWFGYGKSKVDETKREAAAQVASGASKVEKEAEKRA